MILRRMALFLALLFGLGATQLPEFAQQYRQALGGAIGELDRVVSGFNSDVAQQNLTQSAGIDQLLRSDNKLSQMRGQHIQEDIKRLAMLREAQTAFRSEGQVARLGTLVAHYDQQVARTAMADFEPAVPTSLEAFVLGLLGFVIGGGAVHVAGRPLRRRRARSAEAAQQAA